MEVMKNGDLEPHTFAYDVKDSPMVKMFETSPNAIQNFLQVHEELEEYDFLPLFLVKNLCLSFQQELYSLMPRVWIGTT